jgi:serine/threonine-protein kinase
MIAVIAAVFIALASGGLIWYAKPKPKPELPKVLEDPNGAMVLVPGGRALYGKDRETVIVPDFYIDRTEVTNAAYGQFCIKTDRPLPPDFRADRPDDPVVNVTYVDAQAFAKWAGKRLPNSREWEKAARGTEGFNYPWGNQADSSRANVKDNQSLPDHILMPANSFNASISPFGALNMVGNVYEYVDDQITPSAAAVEQFRFLKPEPVVNEPWYAMKGGSFNAPVSQGVAYEWTPIPARFYNRDIGFRCVKNPQNEPQQR